MIQIYNTNASLIWITIEQVNNISHKNTCIVIESEKGKMDTILTPLLLNSNFSKLGEVKKHLRNNREEKTYSIFTRRNLAAYTPTTMQMNTDKVTKLGKIVLR